MRRNSFSVVASDSSHCHRCQLDIDADPQCNGRTRILCPFCGEFLTRANLPTIQLLKQDLEVSRRAVAIDANGHRSLFRNEHERIVSNMVPVFVHVSAARFIEWSFDDRIRWIITAFLQVIDGRKWIRLWQCHRSEIKQRSSNP